MTLCNSNKNIWLKIKDLEKAFLYLKKNQEDFGSKWQFTTLTNTP
jgi:hypothetical protein